LEEARNLVDYLSEKLGVSAAAMAAPVAVAAAPAAGGDAGAAAAPAEQTEFDVTIEEVPSSSRINTIKVLHLSLPAVLY
jgi:large subunit ribosomal protein L7/L12